MEKVPNSLFMLFFFGKLPLPPSLVITTTVELGPGPLGLITCMETRYWV